MSGQRPKKQVAFSLLSHFYGWFRLILDPLLLFLAIGFGRYVSALQGFQAMSFHKGSYLLSAALYTGHFPNALCRFPCTQGWLFAEGAKNAFVVLLQFTLIGAIIIAEESLIALLYFLLTATGNSLLITGNGHKLHLPIQHSTTP